jgi:hypothetical protein
MKLFPPQDDIDTYAVGFSGKDILSRQDAGKRLSELLEKVDDPIVVALDGRWGSGKSYFLKRWVGAHTLENGGTATTIYFDAFANDFLDEPLIALTGAIDERLPKDSKGVRWKKAKRVVVKLAKPIFRIGVAAATAGASEIAVPVIDAAIATAGKEAEKAADAFWRREDGRKAAMKQFRDGLAQLTAPSSEGKGDGKPLVVVIDELDRCRPDYALSMLEVIKHFFSVPRVHFVLGVNLEALEHSVRARYGAGVNARDYLKRFISLSMQLPEFIPGPTPVRATIRYFERCAEAMGVDRALADLISEQLGLAVSANPISLRDIEKILTRLVLLPRKEDFANMLWGWRVLIGSLLLFQVLEPELYRAAMDGSLKPEQIKRFYGIRREMITTEPERSDKYHHPAYTLVGCWSFVLSGDEIKETDKREFARSFDNFGTRGPEHILSGIERDYFSVFSVQD